MAITDIQANNKLIKFTQQINREWVRENMFSPYMSEDINAIIRKRMELKAGGEVMNIPLVTRLQGAGVSTGPLVGNEEKIDDYGYRIWLEWCRNAVATTKAESQKDSADIFGEAKPLLSDWLIEVTRDEIIASFMALPSESQPAAGVRVNGILYESVDCGATQHLAHGQLGSHSVRCLDGQLGDRPCHLARPTSTPPPTSSPAHQPGAAQARCDGCQSAHPALQDAQSATNITSHSRA